MFQNTFHSKQHPPLSNHSRKPKEIKNKPTNTKTKTKQNQNKTIIFNLLTYTSDECFFCSLKVLKFAIFLYFVSDTIATDLWHIATF